MRSPSFPGTESPPFRTGKHSADARGVLSTQAGHVRFVDACRQNRPTQAKFACANCGFDELADLVGALNILSRGMRLLRDEGQDTGDASPGLRVMRNSPDGLWIEPQWRSEAGTRRSDCTGAYSCAAQ